MRVSQLIVAAGCLGWLLLYSGVRQASADEEPERLKGGVENKRETVKPMPPKLLVMSSLQTDTSFNF